MSLVWVILPISSALSLLRTMSVTFKGNFWFPLFQAKLKNNGFTLIFGAKNKRPNDYPQTKIEKIRFKSSLKLVPLFYRRSKIYCRCQKTIRSEVENFQVEAKSLGVCVCNINQRNFFDALYHWTSNIFQPYCITPLCCACRLSNFQPSNFKAFNLAVKIWLLRFQP